MKKSVLLSIGFVLVFLSACRTSVPDAAILQDAPEEPLVSPEASYLLAESALPAYENDLDHAAFISNWTDEFYHKGRVVYRTTCYNCHGDIEQPGSIPNSRQFWKEAFKNGSDPHAMYQTLTRGYGLMPPQVNLTPQEKYEVIHFIREEFIEEHNPDQYFEITDAWVESLPKGTTTGPEPQPYKPWAEMDYGNFLMRTYDLANSTDPPKGISRDCCPIPDEDFRHLNFAYKGIAMRLDEGAGGVAAGNAFALFDHDLLRFTGFWTGEGFIDYEDILLDDQHNVFPRTVGTIQVENPITPGWANPQTGTFEDPRFVAVDGRPFGPLPKSWAHYKGVYYHGDRVVIKYTVGDAEVLETYDLEQTGASPVVSRTLNITPASTKLKMRVAPESAAVVLKGDGATLAREHDFWVLEVPANTSVAAKLLIAGEAFGNPQALAGIGGPPADLSQYTQGGPAHHDQVLTSPIIKGEEDDAYAVDVFALPLDNPWKSRMRPTGIDFLDDPDQAVVSTIDGEVYRLEGLTQTEGVVKWHRIATGLFQPLGIKYHEGKIYVGCRDQIAVLHDLNGDGETDYYESFNSDHQVTEHFHEFAMGLQTDDEGNFYYAKSGRHARKSLIPQHGTLIKVSPDGKDSEILASGFRAANGVLRNPDGSFIVTDQEGFWNPMNRINWVEEGGFYGNMWGYGAPADTSDEAMISPLMWIDSKYDRSPSELLWAESDRWGPLGGHLLNLSYGYGKMFVVMPQMFGDIRQAGMVEIPIPQFPTGVMRGRFNPQDGQLYALGMSAWATNQMIQVGGMYRIRYTGNDLHLPVNMKALTSGMQLTFASALDKGIAENPGQYTITTWDLKRSRKYGSDRYNTKELTIDQVTLSDDGKTVMIHLPAIQPSWIMEIKYNLKGTSGKAFDGAIQNTIYELEPAPEEM
ncbi:MAG: DUF6797 domain-containing protein [Rhodothermales bacterium]